MGADSGVPGEGAPAAAPPVAILYASQTGNAQDVAEAIAREGVRRGFSTVLRSLDAYPVTRLAEERLAVFVAATTGQGDPPTNMQRFWRVLLRRSLPPGSLGRLQYAVFGLGDSGYAKFNVVAKRLDRRLLDLGATPLLPRGLGDDQHPSGYDAALDPWLASLWTVLEQMYPPSPQVLARLAEPRKLDPPKLRVRLHPPPTTNGHVAVLAPALGAGDDVAVAHAAAAQRLAEASAARAALDGALEGSGSSGGEGASGDKGRAYSASQPALLQLTGNQRLTATSHFQDVRHLEFDLRDTGICYEAGDVLNLYPATAVEVVERFCARCQLDAHACLTLEPADAPPQLQAASTLVKLGTLLSAALDIAGASPRRYFFEVASHFASAEHEAERLRYFASAEGRDDLYEYNQREGRTVLEVLEDFPSVLLPLPWLLQVVPRLQPRAFSIASSQRLHPQQAHLTVAVVSWLSPFNRARLGRCSAWLAGLNPQAGPVFVGAWVTRGFLHLPPLPTPLLLIGPGTGCAPFRAFLEERAAADAALKGAPGYGAARCMFFFGCRSQQADFLYKDQWLAWAQPEGVLSDERGGGFYAAFSRDQDEKVYVTHKIHEQGRRVWNLIQAGAVVYVAGSANKMPADVAAALVAVAVKEGGLTEVEAAQWLKSLERTKRYHVEVWS